MRRLRTIWTSYWFTPAPLLDLGINRAILAAILLFLTGLTRYREIALRHPDHWSPVDAIAFLGFAQPDLETMKVLGWCTAVLLVLVGVGLCTRVALLLLLPLIFVEEAMLYSFGKISHGTIPLLYALLFLLLSPCNQRFSLDGLWQRRGGDIPPPVMSSFARWPIDLLYVVLSGFYFSAAVSKLLTSGIRWADGNTLQYYLLYKAEPLGLALAQYPWLCMAGSVAVLCWQLTYPLGMFRRLRPFYLLGGVFFHLSTGFLMGVWFWPVAILCVLFIPWTRVPTWWPVRKRKEFA